MRSNEAQWVSLEMENEPGDAQLSPVYDFNTRRNHWREWRTFSRKHSTRWAEILVWIVLCVLTITFLCLYISASFSKTDDKRREILPEGSKNSLFYSETGYTPFKQFQRNIDYRGVPRVQTSSQGMVASDHGDCSDMGGEILKKGGNAMDAAVTTALCIGIRNPFASGTGGGTFILVRLKNGTSSVIDAREVAPSQASQDMFKGHAAMDALSGGLSVAVPMEMLGLEMLWKRHGKLTWRELIDPVIPLAKDGFSANPELVASLKGSLSRNGVTTMADSMKEIYFVLDEGVWRLPNVGEECCVRPALAKTLELVAKNGVENTYNSEWGDDLIKDIQELPFPGILQKKDLKQSRPVIKEPIKAHVFGMDVVSVPPPSSSVTLIMALKFLESYTDHSDQTLNYHRLAEAMKHMFAVRTHLGDPGTENEFLNLDKVLKDILKPSFIDELRKITTDSGIQDISEYGGRYKETNEKLLDEGTSHICTADDEGNAVSLTTSINWSFGSLMAAKRTGLLLNNHIADFTIVGSLDQPPSPSSTTAANLIFPGRKPLSSMSPLIFTENQKLKLAIGASGGFRIITSLLQVLHNHLRLGMDLETAINAGRIACFFSDSVHVEDVQRGHITFNTSDEILEGLKHLGHHTQKDNYISDVVAVQVTDDGLFRGFVDPRKDGATASNL